MVFIKALHIVSIKNVIRIFKYNRYIRYSCFGSLDGLILTVSKELAIGYIPFNKYQKYDQKL